MKPQTTVIPAQVLSQGEEEQRIVLRPLLRALVQAPGALGYNPVYVGPLHRVDPLRMEVVACLEALPRPGDESGSPYQNTPQLVDPALLGGVGAVGPMVTIMTEQEALGLLRSDFRVPPDLQMIIWGERPGSEVNDYLRVQLEARGLIFDPSAYRAAAMTNSGFSMTLLRATAQRGAGANPVVVVGDAGRLAVLSALVQLKMEVGQLDPVDVFSLSQLPDASFWGDLGRGAGAVLRIASLGDADERRDLIGRVEAMVRRGILVVLVVDREAQELLVNDSAWRTLQAHAVTLPALEDDSPAEGEGLDWPLPSEVLLGAPQRRPETAQVLSFNLDSVALSEVLQLAEAFHRPGHLVLYGEDRFGYIEMGGSEVLFAARLGDAVTDVPREEVLARIRDMVLWREGQVVFVPVAPGARMERRFAGKLPLEAVAMDAARVVDEQRVGRLSSEGFAAPARRVKPYQVAESLLKWGLLSPAIALLQRAERRSGFGVEEDLLLGHLTAERDPQQAVARLRHAAFRLAGEESEDPSRMALQIDATLNALVLEVRAQGLKPQAAWTLIERWLESAGDTWVTTSRHAAIVFEIAFRAGRMDDARRFLMLIFERSSPQDPLVEAFEAHRRVLASGADAAVVAAD